VRSCGKNIFLDMEYKKQKYQLTNELMHISRIDEPFPGMFEVSENECCECDSPGEVNTLFLADEGPILINKILYTQKKMSCSSDMYFGNVAKNYQDIRVSSEENIIYFFSKSPLCNFPTVKPSEDKPYEDTDINIIKDDYFAIISFNNGSFDLVDFKNKGIPSQYIEKWNSLKSYNEE
jgi:hypothetical protein